MELLAVAKNTLQHIVEIVDTLQFHQRDRLFLMTAKIGIENHCSTSVRVEQIEIVASLEYCNVLTVRHQYAVVVVGFEKCVPEKIAVFHFYFSNFKFNFVECKCFLSMLKLQILI